MPRRNPEQELIDSFIGALETHSKPELRLSELINSNFKSRKYADVEYVSESGLHWVIEAKSNDSGDAHNTVHKIFGELLKETGKANRGNCRYAVLLPQSGAEFYSQKFQVIRKNKYLKYGKLIPINTVFMLNDATVSTISWEDLYEMYRP